MNNMSWIFVMTYRAGYVLETIWGELGNLHLIRFSFQQTDLLVIRRWVRWTLWKSRKTSVWRTVWVVVVASWGLAGWRAVWARGWLRLPRRLLLAAEVLAPAGPGPQDPMLAVWVVVVVVAEWGKSQVRRRNYLPQVKQSKKCWLIPRVTFRGLRIEAEQ